MALPPSRFRRRAVERREIAINLLLSQCAPADQHGGDLAIHMGQSAIDAIPRKRFAAVPEV